MTHDQALFASAHAALVFAFEHSAQTYDRPVMNRMAAPAFGSGKGLGGLDGSAQAGMIRREVRDFGRLGEALLIGRHAPQYAPCSCRAPCCSGKRPNHEWLDAVAFLADHLRTTALADCSTTSLMRRAYVARYFTPKSGRLSIEELSEQFEKDRHTVSAHYGRVAKLLGGVESRRGKDGDPGLEKLAIQAAEDLFAKLGWLAVAEAA